MRRLNVALSWKGYRHSVRFYVMPGLEHAHFRFSNNPHPLKAKPDPLFKEQQVIGVETDHLRHRIWTEEEVNECMKHVYRHQPQTISDRIANLVMLGCYNGFNLLTGYRHDNPTVKSIIWRLIVLESIAGVPGFVAAGFRHFRGLSWMFRDHGWIPTLLEEAENERMHLILVLENFHASRLTRFLVLCGQGVMIPAMMLTCLVHPRSVHRFVGYLEETAIHSYINIIKHIETPGTLLYREWANEPAPEIGIKYYRLEQDAKWVDCLKCLVSVISFFTSQRRLGNNRVVCFAVSR